MPAAKDGRRPAGTAHCSACDTEATFYQVKKGKRKGFLYKRCGCGCNQSAGEPQQKQWLAEMTPTEEMIPHPMQAAEPEPEPAEPESEPAAEPAPEPAPRKGFAGLLLLGVAGLTALLMT
ncbi:hypothetical protein HBA55_34385 [Pseudomaricurvus alkylphenolicus]|uniref:hypothetical protein n=1 Tax=Pseudomaricurvus alkylphenolicus TaxID=1306991 RepID=UPI0014211BCC|nr:hypothetical protein [Pseudomaricurvus alkylphenolicus]NIB44719.1 hypothetical protein [Pseudomaricurvus alkylphenolicus]